MHKFMAFDLEIAKVLPENTTDWKDHRPLGISCAATYAADASMAKLWYSTANGEPLPEMTVGDVRSMIDYLRYKANHEGYTILTWNGLSFDFAVLHESSGYTDNICEDLAWNHVDMMWQVFCIRNHFLGLSKAAAGMGVPGKLDGVNGADAPVLWQKGEYATALEYVAQDAKCTLDVALAVENAKHLRWTSNKGRPNTLPIDGWLTAREAARLPLPDTSWMTNPIPRAQFTEWMHQINNRPSQRIITYLQRVFEKTNDVADYEKRWLEQWQN